MHALHAWRIRPWVRGLGSWGVKCLEGVGVFWAVGEEGWGVLIGLKIWDVRGCGVWGVGVRVVEGLGGCVFGGG